MELLTEQMKVSAGITEELKAKEQMKCGIDEQCPLCCGGDCAERVGVLLMNSCWISRYICDKSRTGKEIYC